MKRKQPTTTNEPSYKQTNRKHLTEFDTKKRQIIVLIQMQEERKILIVKVFIEQYLINKLYTQTPIYTANTRSGSECGQYFLFQRERA